MFPTNVSPVELKVILSSDWPQVLTELLEWAGLWLFTLDVLEKSDRRAALCWRTSEGSRGSSLCTVVCTTVYTAVYIHVLLPWRVWPAVGFWPQSPEEFPRCQLRFCVVCRRHGNRLWCIQLQMEHRSDESDGADRTRSAAAHKV